MKVNRNSYFPRQSILNVLTIGFGGLILAAVALVLYLGLSFSTSLTKDYHQLLIETALEDLNEEVEGLLLPVEAQALWISDQVEAERLDIHDYSKVENFLRGVLGATPSVTGVGIVYPDGFSRYILRQQNQWTISQDFKRDEITQLFEQMEDAVTTVWSKLFWFDDLEQTIIDVRLPLRQNGKLEGVLFIGVTVAELSKSILRTSTDQHLTPFILYGPEHLLAHPILTSGQTVPAEDGQNAGSIIENNLVPLPEIRSFQDTILAELIFGDLLEARLVNPIDSIAVNTARIDGDTFIIATQELRRFGEIPWITGVYINGEKSDRTAALRLFEMAGAGLLILFLSVVAAYKVGRKLARPIERLSGAARAVRRGSVEGLDPLPRSRLTELDQAALAFNEMVDGLRERNMIREVFGRYVPETVAASLMRESGELKPTSTTATVLFSDLEGFTRLTEEVGPERIVAILNEYFSAIVEILEEHGGVVTQFQGDAVLATFNVPIEDENHAENAIKAALGIKEMLCERTFEGKSLRSRIGINTGEVVAGAVGAEGRLNYTVHGDAVNLAARIESLNKEYETTVLISEYTACHVSHIDLKQIGRTSVRGRHEDVILFSVD